MDSTNISKMLRRAALAIAGTAAVAVPASASAALPSTNCQSLPAGTCRAEPFFPNSSPLVANLGSTVSPEDDLAQALEDLGAAPDAATAAKARGRALAILEGDPSSLVTGDTAFLDGRAYKGIPLLNWNLPAKVKTVTAGTPVDVTEVRFGDHALLDTWLLKFTDPTQPYKINWRVTELGTSFGGELSPAAVPDAGAAGHASVDALALPSLATGITATSRFHPGPSGAAEDTRLATQSITVDMPAPNSTSVILDPNLKPGHETFAQIAIDRPGRLTAAEAALGFAGSAPTAAEKDAAINKLSHDSAEWLIWDALKRADPNDPAVALDVAKAAGANNRILVAAMRTRDMLPVPSSADATADVNVQFANNEAYVSKRALRVAPDTTPNGAVTLSVTNLDGFAHTFSVRQLHGRNPVFGVLNWGRFTTDELTSVSVPAGATRAVTVTPAAGAFSLWVGDTELGDQSGMAIELDRGPRRQSLELGLGPIKPLHQSLDSSGRIWITMANSDEVVRLTPGDAAVTDATPERFPLPGGIRDPQHLPPPDQPQPPLLGPGDVQIDGHGIVWVTLTAGNAIARIDPAQVNDGTTAGIKIFNLTPCDQTCRRPPGAAVVGPLSRLPLQLRLYEDGGGNTVMFFTEQNADRIGMLRVSAAGTKLNETHYTCGCQQPLGIAFDADGNVWFSEGTNNRLGRMTLDQTRPYSGTTMAIDHFNIPSSIKEFVPGEPLCPAPGSTVCAPPALPNPQTTSLPHSVAVDRSGRVWFTEEATQKIGYLDVAKAKPGTTDGFVDVAGPMNDFERHLAPADIAFDRAGRAYISDEYGDQIATATVNADGSIATASTFRPVERNSLTDSPMVDDKGNLWFLEAGANLITRIKGVTAGQPLPARAPMITADTAARTVTATGLREMSSVDLRLFRGATMVAQATAVDVSPAGGFSATLPLAADDRLEIVPRGANAPAPFSFRVARLTAGVGAGGVLSGRALVDGKALPDDVSIDAGNATLTAPIAAADGAYSWAGGLDPASARGTVSWTAGTTTARFRTVTPFAPVAPGAGGAPPAGADTATPPASDSGAGAVAATPAPAAPAAGPNPAQPAKPKARAVDLSCSRTRWMVTSGAGTAARRILPLLGLKTADAQACLGRPARRTRSGKSERWTYPGQIELRLGSGRVTGFTLLGGRLRSDPDAAAVGGSVQRMRDALGAVVKDGRRGYRSLVAVGSAYADVRIAVRGSRVTRVTVTLTQRRSLDAVGRRLLGMIR